MDLNWTKEYAFGPLEQFQQVAPDLYRQRRNGQKLPPANEGEPETWVYESRTISKEQYDSYMEMLDSPAQERIARDFETLSEGQTTLDGNSLVTMSAIADLYELLTNALLQLQGGKE